MQYQIQQFLPLIEQALSELPVPETPESLYDPVRYFMKLPGKRIRPVFVLQALELFRQPLPEDANAALCTELFHNFSLVHDDIMDKADLRRGFQTVHKKWNEPTAILAGDALLVMAYDALLEFKGNDLRPLIKSFNAMSLAVCEGQQLDMDFSEKQEVSMEEYQNMIDRKTAALIAFSFELGGFLGGVSENDRIKLRQFGMSMGRCFQLRDDYLDLFGDEKLTGKKRGGDIGNYKLSHPVLESMKDEDAGTFLSLWKNKELNAEIRIQAILKWMEDAGIPERCNAVLIQEMDAGINLLNGLNMVNHEALNRTINLCRELAFRDK
jgi:geranylgeranyl diphosphate synthase type II